MLTRKQAEIIRNQNGNRDELLQSESASTVALHSPQPDFLTGQLHQTNSPIESPRSRSFEDNISHSAGISTGDIYAGIRNIAISPEYPTNVYT